MNIATATAPAAPRSNRALRALVLAPVAAVAVLAGPATTGADAATPVTGAYTLHYDWYSSGGQWNTSSFTLNTNGSCTGFTSPCTWKVSGSAFSLTFPNARRGSVTYAGTVTPAGLSSATSPGHMYFGTTGSTPEGNWYATKP